MRNCVKRKKSGMNFHMRKVKLSPCTKFSISPFKTSISHLFLFHTSKIICIFTDRLQTKK